MPPSRGDWAKSGRGMNPGTAPRSADAQIVYHEERRTDPESIDRIEPADRPHADRKFSGGAEREKQPSICAESRQGSAWPALHFPLGVSEGGAGGEVKMCLIIASVRVQAQTSPCRLQGPPTAPPALPPLALIQASERRRRRKRGSSNTANRPAWRIVFNNQRGRRERRLRPRIKNRHPRAVLTPLERTRSVRAPLLDAACAHSHPSELSGGRGAEPVHAVKSPGEVCVATHLHVSPPPARCGTCVPTADRRLEGRGVRDQFRGIVVRL